MNTLYAFIKDESGTSSLEYAFIAALLSIVAIAAMKNTGSQLTTTYNGVATGVTNANQR